MVNSHLHFIWSMSIYPETQRIVLAILSHLRLRRMGLWCFFLPHRSHFSFSCWCLFIFPSSKVWCYSSIWDLYSFSVQSHPELFWDHLSPMTCKVIFLSPGLSLGLHTCISSCLFTFSICMSNTHLKLIKTQNLDKSFKTSASLFVPQQMVPLFFQLLRPTNFEYSW